ncbi:MAG: hypothetical protein KDA85_21145 [Planctomycetaceae bacterium]|nr:hypothetical protein [Planctomycetaceae bacterium]
MIDLQGRYRCVEFQGQMRFQRVSPEAAADFHTSTSRHRPGVICFDSLHTESDLRTYGCLQPPRHVPEALRRVGVDFNYIESTGSIAVSIRCFQSTMSQLVLSEEEERQWNEIKTAETQRIATASPTRVPSGAAASSLGADPAAIPQASFTWHPGGSPPPVHSWMMSTIVSDTLKKLQFHAYDCETDVEIQQLYLPCSLLRVHAPVPVARRYGAAQLNTRFLIATNKLKTKPGHPAEFTQHIPAPTDFLVVDRLKSGHITQILLLHIVESARPVFQRGVSPEVTRLAWRARDELLRLIAAASPHGAAVEWNRASNRPLGLRPGSLDEPDLTPPDGDWRSNPEMREHPFLSSTAI